MPAPVQRIQVNGRRVGAACPEGAYRPDLDDVSVKRRFCLPWYSAGGWAQRGWGGGRPWIVLQVSHSIMHCISLLFCNFLNKKF